MFDKWDFYKDNAKEWRWRRKSNTGKVVGASPRGYKNKFECRENARKHGYKE